MDVDHALTMIGRLVWLAKGSRLWDVGLPEQLLLASTTGDVYVDREPVEGWCRLGFLLVENGTDEDSNPRPEFKLSEKAHRLIEVQEARQSESNPNKHLWIVVTNGDVFIDKGESPPDLSALIGEKWNAGDRIVISCHDPRSVRIRDLQLALASDDPLFIADSHEVTEDFKYADAEVEAL